MAVFRLTDPTEPPSDRELIDRTLSGDGDAFAALVERFQRKIFRLAFGIVHDEDEADAITQDAFVNAYTNLRRFEGRSGFETWLTRIAINRSRDFLRRRRFVSLLTAEDEPIIEPVDEREDAERMIMASQLRAAIRRAEKTLSPQQQLIFRLRHHEEMTAEEIAAHVGLESSTVRAHLFRASQKIRKALAAWREGIRK